MAPDLLNHQFMVAEPNRALVADITAIWTLERWLYLATALDLYNPQLVGSAMADHMRSQLVIDALEMAVGRRQLKEGLLHHNDRGSQYASHDYRSTLDRNGFQTSMSRKGNCWDNAVLERFFGSLKSEWLADQQYETHQAARRDVTDYIEMEYKSFRLHSTHGYQSPREIELAAAA